MASNYLSQANKKIADYVSQQLADKVGDIPALLFTTNNTDYKFPSIILFDKFGISQENSLSFQSEITEHYVEDNTVRNDHWAIKPKVYILTGLIGEVIYQKPSGLSAFLDDLENNLTPLTALIPTLGNYTKGAVAIVSQVQSSLKRYKDIATQAYTAITGVGKQTQSNQQVVIDKLQSLIKERQLVDVASPYGVLTNMAVTNVIIRQNEDTKFSSSVEVTLQEWRSVETFTRSATKDEKALLNNLQSATVSNNGEAQTENRSLLNRMFGQFENTPINKVITMFGDVFKR